MNIKIDTCVYCGRDIEKKLLEQILSSDKNLLSVLCEDGVCCIEFRCDDD